MLDWHSCQTCYPLEIKLLLYYYYYFIIIIIIIITDEAQVESRNHLTSLAPWRLQVKIIFTV